MTDPDTGDGDGPDDEADDRSADGASDRSGPFDTPAAAEAAFYDALERADLAAIAAVWATGDEVCCVHPGIDRVEGRAAVLDSFARMFAGDARLAFEIVDVVFADTGRLSVHHARERIRIDGRLVGIMAATNVYVFEGDGWRMLVHHASHEGGSPLEEPADENGGKRADDGPQDPVVTVPPGRTLH